nr:hypothetical protein [Tanacetum cinerariifolium]GEV88557.1 hypothetical protein [Tanacetum cinerariifolium]
MHDIFFSLHSHLQVLYKEDLKGTRIEHGFKRAFLSLFGKDNETFTSTMLLNIDQLHKQLDKDEFQKDGSMAAFWVINRQFHMFIDLQFTLDYDSQMTDKYFDEYTGIKVKQFRETLLQHMGNVKNKIDVGKEVDVDLVITEGSGTESEVQDDSSRSRNNTDTDDAEIRPIYDEEPMAEVQLTTECNIFAIGQQHTKQPEIINEGQHGQILNEASNKAKIKKEIDAYETINIELEHKVATSLKETDILKKYYKDLYDYIKITTSKTIEQTTSLLANNADLKAQIQENVFVIVALKNELRKLKGNSVVNLRAKIQSHKTRNSNKLVDQKSHTQKPGRRIITGHRFSPNKSSAVYEKTSPRSCLSLFGPLLDEYFNGENQVVSKSSVVTTIDASAKRQQQPDSTSSTSPQATTVTADGNFGL